MKTMIHIESYEDGRGHVRFHAFDPVNMVSCGHAHRYEAPANACLKQMLKEEEEANHEHNKACVADDGDGRQYCIYTGKSFTVEQAVKFGFDYSSPVMERLEEIRDEQTAVVSEVIEGRRGVYGEPRETYPRVAQIWSGIIGAEVTATDVPLMLIGYKLLRANISPDYSDNSDDVEGYLAIFRELVGDDMIHARSVDEYLKLRSERGGNAR